ncbi:MAG: alpha/beta fold hydrolase [Candidatus Diapherotrites archaeon]|nr:alpha/beta fold hydrolase [Candidatus Diapherotrites archaeon]
MEHISFRNPRGLSLSGAYYPAKSDQGILISHGFTSNKDRAHFVQLAEQLNKAGFSVLRFDFSGCGESDAASITVAGEVDDLKSAMEWMRKKGHSTLGLYGSSLGGLVSLKAYSPDVKAIVLWAPVTDNKKPSTEIGTIGDIDKAYEDQGHFVLQKEDGREFRISKEYFDERAAVDQEELLAPIRCPVLILHGDADKTVPLEGSKKAIKRLSKGCELGIIAGAGHRFADNKADLKKMIARSVEWFKEYL